MNQGLVSPSVIYATNIYEGLTKFQVLLMNKIDKYLTLMEILFSYREMDIK